MTAVAWMAWFLHTGLYLLGNILSWHEMTHACLQTLWLTLRQTKEPQVHICRIFAKSQYTNFRWSHVKVWWKKTSVLKRTLTGHFRQQECKHWTSFWLRDQFHPRYSDYLDIGDTDRFACWSSLRFTFAPSEESGVSSWPNANKSVWVLLGSSLPTASQASGAKACVSAETLSFLSKMLNLLSVITVLSVDKIIPFAFGIYSCQGTTHQLSISMSLNLVYSAFCTCRSLPTCLSISLILRLLIRFYLFHLIFLSDKHSFFFWTSICV